MEKPKKTHSFHFGFRKEMLKNLILIAVMVGFLFLMMPLLGINNAMVAVMSLLGILMTLKNDYTLQPAKNTAIFLTLQIGLGLAAYVASLHTVSMILTTLGVVFLVVYLFTFDEKQSIYFPFLLNFIMMIYYPVRGTELIIRLSILAGSALLIMLLQFLLNRNKFRKGIKKNLQRTMDSMHQLLRDMQAGKETSDLTAQNDAISASLQGISGSIDSRLAQLKKWQEGHYYFKATMFLKSFNQTLRKNYIEPGKAPDEQTGQSLHALLDTIATYENNEMTPEALRKQMQFFWEQLRNAQAPYEIKDEMDVFVKGELEEEDVREERLSFWDKLKGRFNLYNFIFAAKTSVIAAIGVAIVEIFHLPSGYMLPLTIVIITQPYIELNRKSSGNRLLHTFYGVTMFFISFSITNLLWVHFLILAAFIVVGDMFLQYNFTVVYSTLLSLIMGTISMRGTVASLSVYRLAYVAAACILLMLVDNLIFPRRILATLKKQVQHSVELNDVLIQTILQENSNAESIHRILVEKRQINQKIKTTNQYVKDPKIVEYLVSEQEWTSRMLILFYDLRTHQISRQELCQMMLEQQAGSLQGKEFTEESSKLLQSSLQALRTKILQSQGLVCSWLSFSK